MDETTRLVRLVRCQRIVIGVLLCALGLMSLMAFAYRHSGERDRAAAEVFQTGYLERGEALRAARERQELDGSFIDDLSEKLVRSEARQSHVGHASKD